MMIEKAFRTAAFVCVTLGLFAGCGNSTTTTSSSGGATTAASSSGASSAGSATTGAACACAPKFCDPLGTSRCLDCLSNTDCTDPSEPLCQTAADLLDYGKCVQCDEATPTCPSGEVCDLSLGRTYHQCVPDCRLSTTTPPCDNDAGLVEHCVQATGTCGKGCAAQSDCVNQGSQQLCDLDGGGCVECLAPSDCPYSNPGCELGACGTCIDDTNCPAGMGCTINELGYGYCGCPDGGGCGGNAPVCYLTSTSVTFGEALVCGCQANRDCSPQHSVCGPSQSGAGACIPPCNDGGTDCTPNGQFCDLGTGLCGPCNDNSQCVGNPAGSACTFGTCGCFLTSDCPSGDVCNEPHCLASCDLDGGTNCASQGSFCNADSGLCGPCGSDSECAGADGGPKCIATGICGCNQASDCGTGNVCANGQCLPSCAIDGGTDCSNIAGAHFCDFGTGVCGPCSEDSQCIGNDAGPHCQYGDCGCKTTNDCGSTQACDPATAQCTTSCTVDGGPDCSSSALVCDPVSGVCVQCTDDSQCPPFAPACTATIHQGNTCVQCILPSQCPASTPGCNSAYFGCGSCSADADCPTTQPLCDNGQCVSSCVLADGGTFCATGVCQTSTGFCVQCLQDSDCQTPGSNYCAADLDLGNYCVQCVAASNCGDAGPCNGAYLFCGSCAYNSDCPVEVPICSTQFFGYCTDGGF
jgi:hypothetical protein